jgi:hypothetical protein
MALIKDIPTHAVERVLLRGTWYDVYKGSFQIHGFQFSIKEGTVYSGWGSGNDGFSFTEMQSKKRISGPMASVDAVQCHED